MNIPFVILYEFLPTFLGTTSVHQTNCMPNGNEEDCMSSSNAKDQSSNFSTFNENIVENESPG